MTCDHKHFTARVDVHRIVKEEDDARVGYENAPVQNFIFEAIVSCAECGVPFVFEWESLPPNNTTVPVTLEAMKNGPWTSVMRDIINASIKPMEAGVVHVTNNSGTTH